MLINNYDKATGEFIIQTDAKPNPLEANAFLIPANAVDEALYPLPTLLANEVAVFDPNGTTGQLAGAWVVTPDFRGDQSWYLNTNGLIVDFALSEIPDGTMSQTFPAAVQAQLDEAQRISEIANAGLALINAVFPALSSIDEIKFQSEFWLSINPTARQATPDFQMVIDVYQVAKAAIQGGTPSADVVWP